jgi:hypothetical protein
MVDILGASGWGEGREKKTGGKEKNAGWVCPAGLKDFVTLVAVVSGAATPLVVKTGVLKVLLPLELVEQFAKTETACGVDHLNEGDSPVEMAAIVVVAVSILALGTESNAVGQCRLQAIEVVAGNVQTLVHHHSGKSLANALPHDARLAMVHRESFLHGGRTHVKLESSGDALKIAVPRERKIVGITRIDGLSGVRQAVQPAIHPIGAEVGKRRRCGCALRQMGL